MLKVHIVINNVCICGVWLEWVEGDKAGNNSNSHVAHDSILGVIWAAWVRTRWTQETNPGNKALSKKMCGAHRLTFPKGREYHPLNRAPLANDWGGSVCGGLREHEVDRELLSWEYISGIQVDIVLVRSLSYCIIILYVHTYHTTEKHYLWAHVFSYLFIVLSLTDVSYDLATYSNHILDNWEIGKS